MRNGLQGSDGRNPGNEVIFGNGDFSEQIVRHAVILDRWRGFETAGEGGRIAFFRGIVPLVFMQLGILHNTNYAKFRCYPKPQPPRCSTDQNPAGPDTVSGPFYFLGEIMRYPNLRYGDPAALAYYTQFYPEKERVRMLARQLRRSERSVRDWLSGAEKMPWWVPEIVRLQRLEHVEMMRQMNMQPARPQLGVVAGTVLEFKRPDPVSPAVPMLQGSKLLIC